MFKKRTRPTSVRRPEEESIQPVASGSNSNTKEAEEEDG